MRLSLKTKQVAGVTSIVGLVTVVLSLVYLAWIARVGLSESRSRGDLLTNAIYQQARVVTATPEGAYAALRGDPGIRSILESSIAYSPNVTYAAIVDTRDVAIAHSSPSLQGGILEPQASLDALLRRNVFAQLRAIYSDRTFEVQQPLLMGDERFGSIRIGMSTILVRDELLDALAPAALLALVGLVVATAVATALAQWMLRPIHVLQSGLARLGQGEFDVRLDLPPGDEFAELGTSFNTVSRELASVRSRLAGQSAHLESLVDSVEDAVAMVNPDGELIFANGPMQTFAREALSGTPAERLFPRDHPFGGMLEEALASRQSQGPRALPVIVPDQERPAEVLLMAHAILDVDGRFVGVMLVARNLGYLSQVQSTLQYSRKLAALGRLMAGVAHEVKNPLNAMTIHLELLREKLKKSAATSRRPRPALAGVSTDGPSLDLSPGGDEAGEPEGASVREHVAIIAEEIGRLDAVVQGFLKFSRPEEISLQTIELHGLIDDVIDTVRPQADSGGVTIVNECPADLPPVGGDEAMLRQALLNLALNACQAMPGGGRLRFAARPESGRRVELEVEDTGAGIPPEHLERIFDLYFTTKPGGSGMGLPMVFRTVQLHDGNIEVQSTPGRGTTFRILLPQDRRREPRDAT